MVTATAVRSNSPTPAKAQPTQTYVFPPTPTVIPNLVERQPADPNLQLPDGFALEIYRITRPPMPEEIGYEEILRSMGDQSRVHALPQGYYYWDTAALTLMERNNAALAPFGYRIASKATGENQSRWFELYQGDKKILDPITQLGPVSVNHSGTDFLMLVDAGGIQLVRKSSIAPWKHVVGEIRNSRPQFLGDDLMHIELSYGATPTPTKMMETDQPAPLMVQVYRGSQSIYQTTFQDRPAANGIIGFWTYGEHWALETINSIVIDGQKVNALYGCSKSYEFHLLGGKPLFFYERAGQFGLNLDGIETAFPYEDISHYGCCSAGAFNPVQIGDLLLFFARNDNTPYYFELAAGAPSTTQSALPLAGSEPKLNCLKP